MGIAVNDPEDSAGYDGSYASSKNQKETTCNCACSCDSRNASSISSTTSNGSTTSSSSNGSSSSCCCSSNNSSCKYIGNTLTLTFANHNSYGPACSYKYSKTETLSTPSMAAAMATATTTSITRPTRDLIGNSKEYRIESNKNDLRIIGNGNRIRIGCNQGNLQIIGNNTRLKITNNTGGIRYTGNEGRICLGSDSTQQIIDYIGNNGKLKVVKSSEMLSEKNKSHKQKIPKEMMETEMTVNTEKNRAASAKVNIVVDGEPAAAAAAVTTNSTAFPSHSTPKKVKVKSASYGGDFSAQWRQFNELFEKHGWRNFASASMPNLKNEKVAKNNIGEGKKAEQNTKHGKNNKINAKCCKIDSNINIVSNYGNICIKNAVNVSM